jgi:hypothetical protein
MANRAAILAVLLLLPFPLSAQDKKPPKRPAGPLELETDHWKVTSAVPAIPGKDFEEMLEAYYALWEKKAGGATASAGGRATTAAAGKLKLKLYYDREEFNSQPGRQGGYFLKDDELNVLADNKYAYSIGAGGPRIYLQAVYPGIDRRKDVPPWVVSGLTTYLACAQWKDGQIDIDSLKLPQHSQSLLSLQNMMKSSDWGTFEKGFKADGRDYEIRRRVIDLQAWGLFYYLFNAPAEDGGKSANGALVPSLMSGLSEGRKMDEVLAPLLKLTPANNMAGLEKSVKDYYQKIKLDIKDREEGDWIVGDTAHYTIHVQKGALNKKTKANEKQILEELKWKMELLFEKYSLAFRFQGLLSQKAVLKLHKSKVSYIGAGGPPNSAAYYSPGTKELVGYEDSEETGMYFHTLCHEGCHQFFDLAFPGFYESDSIPMWFSEGLADCFGASEIRGKDLFVFTLGGTASWRVDAVKQYAQQGSLPSLKDLLGMGQRPFMAGAQIHYPQSWSFVHFLWNYPSLDSGKGQYSEIVIKLIDGFKVGKPRDEVYREAFQVKGKTVAIEDLEKEWKAYVKTLKVRK